MKDRKRAPRHKKTAPFSREVTFLLPPSIGDDDKIQIKFRMIATPENWERLCRFSYDDKSRQHLGKLFSHHVLLDVQQFLDNNIFKRKPRGVHAQQLSEPGGKTEAEFMTESRRFVAATKGLAAHWITVQEEKWPGWFSETISALRKSKANITHNRTGHLVDGKIAYELWKSEFKSERRKQGLPGPKDYKSFRRTYIERTHGNIVDAAEKCAKDVIEHQNPDVRIHDIVELLP